MGGGGGGMMGGPPIIRPKPKPAKKPVKLPPKVEETDGNEENLSPKAQSTSPDPMEEVRN